MSTSCGLPDFRSKDGVYAIVGKDSRIQDPTDLFNIEFFRTNVQPFYDFAKELWPGKVTLALVIDLFEHWNRRKFFSETTRRISTH